jgi:hypothetical protein
MKRNRDALAQMAIYDLLCRMQDNISNVLKEETICYLDIVAGDHDEPCRAKKCQECLQKWLNEEAK